MRVWEVDPHAIDHEAIEEAGKRLREGGLIAFPTETVYGLGANALNDTAVRAIFEAKGRPADNPLIVHIADASGLKEVVAPDFELPAAAIKAIKAFWPGPLTLILPASEKLAAAVHPGMATVGVRCPNNPIARALIRAAGVPVAAPSANRSGRPSPTCAKDVQEDLASVLDGLIDGGSCTEGLESTVVRITDQQATIYRPGTITKEALEEVLQLPVVDVTQKQDDANEITATNDHAPAPSPGMKYRHYAPNADVYVWTGDPVRVQVAMMQFIAEHDAAKTAVISPRQFSGRCCVWMPEAGEEYGTALARNLYRVLREFDREGVSYILIQGVERKGVGAALMNRLERAAEGRVYEV